MGKPYRVCPDCGAHLDAGERCDCKDAQDKEEPAAERDSVQKKAG